jgi:putative membrane protein insertion efficiency factor
MSSLVFLGGLVGEMGVDGRGNIASGVLLTLVRKYQKYVSPCLPACCIYYPTCSQYAVEAIERYGALKGGWLAFRRVLRCNPFHTGGFDPVP